VLLAVASVTTPLGLYDGDFRASEPQLARFVYAKDKSSSLGDGTLPRSALGFNRMCWGYPFWLCPGPHYNVSESEWNMTTEWQFNDMRIPQIVSDIFASGKELLGSTVSSIFDIEWRTYNIDRQEGLNNGTDYIIGNYRQMASLMLQDNIEIVEGLIVDTKNGGIGFRNHSIPADTFSDGVEWTEDILFIQPETRCVNTNLTIEFNLPTFSGLNTTSHLYLTDRGGFVNIERDFEYWNTYAYLDNRTQTTLDLRDRAYRGAWLNNGNTMRFMNITGPSLRNASRFGYLESSIGQRRILANQITTIPDPTYTTNYRSIQSHRYGHYINSIVPNGVTTRNITNATVYTNPWNITWEYFYDPRK
jgi:hypothetical protein